MRVKSTVSLLISYDRITGQGRFKVKGLRAGDELLLKGILEHFSRIAGSEGFRNKLIKESFSKSSYKSKSNDVAPIHRKSSGRGVIV